MTDKQIIIDGEHDMNYCEDNNCKHYGNKEQCEKTHCYYRCYSKLYTAHKAKEQECERLKKQNDIMLNSLKKLQNKICSNTSQCKYFLMDVLKEVENV